MLTEAEWRREAKRTITQLRPVVDKLTSIKLATVNPAAHATEHGVQADFIQAGQALTEALESVRAAIEQLRKHTNL